MRNKASFYCLSFFVFCDLFRDLICYFVFFNLCVIENSSYHYRVSLAYQLLSSVMNLARYCLLDFTIDISYFLNDCLRVEKYSNCFLISRYIQRNFQSIRDLSKLRVEDFFVFAQRDFACFLDRFSLLCYCDFHFFMLQSWFIWS